MNGSRRVDDARPDPLRRSLRVLEALAGMEQPASLLDVTAAVGLSKASTYRVLRALQDDGYVDHLGRRGYRIGSRSVALGSLIGPRPNLVKRARPVLSRLAAAAGETTTLHLRSGEHRVLVLFAEPDPHPHPIEVRLGERAPLTSGCSGRAILAHLPTEEATDVIDRHVRGRTRARLERELESIRSTGYAMSFRENHAQFHGISAALLDPDDDRPLGSIAIAGIDRRLPEDALRRLGRPLSAACRQLAPHLATILGPNSFSGLEALDVTIQTLVDSANSR